MNKQRLTPYFFFGVLSLLLYQMLRILSPFFVAALGAAILALTLYPIHEKILARVRRPNAAAGVSTALMVFIVVLPILFVGWMFLKETAKVYPMARHWAEDVRNRETHPGDPVPPPELLAAWENLRGTLESWGLDPQDAILNNLGELSSNMTHVATLIIKDLAFVLFNLLVLIFTLFFFLRDGASMINAFTDLIPMSHQHKQVILLRTQDTLYAVLRGMIIVSAAHGLLTGLGFAIFGVPFPVLLGTLATFTAPIPLVGTAIIWLPVVAGLMLEGSFHQAAYVGAWCLVVVATVDHLLRPLIIGNRAKIPMLLLFLGLLGGLRVYGFTGLLVGPVISAIFLSFVKIYREEYHWLLQEFRKSS